jgi:hypothetical protein
MPMSQVTYTRELEVLILETLLPVYYKYYSEKGVKPSKLDINPDLLKQIRTKTVLPALLRPKEKQS